MGDAPLRRLCLVPSESDRGQTRSGSGSGAGALVCRSPSGGYVDFRAGSLRMCDDILDGSNGGRWTAGFRPEGGGGPHFGIRR